MEQQEHESDNHLALPHLILPQDQTIWVQQFGYNCQGAGLSKLFVNIFIWKVLIKVLFTFLVPWEMTLGNLTLVNCPSCCLFCTPQSLLPSKVCHGSHYCSMNKLMLSIVEWCMLLDYYQADTCPLSFVKGHVSMMFQSFSWHEGKEAISLQSYFS